MQAAVRCSGSLWARRMLGLQLSGAVSQISVAKYACTAIPGSVLAEYETQPQLPGDSTRQQPCISFAAQAQRYLSQFHWAFRCPRHLLLLMQAAQERLGRLWWPCSCLLLGYVCVYVFLNCFLFIIAWKQFF